jgi:hypothetical protein
MRQARYEKKTQKQGLTNSVFFVEELRMIVMSTVETIVRRRVSKRQSECFRESHLAELWGLIYGDSVDLQTTEQEGSLHGSERRSSPRGNVERDGAPE